MATIRNVCVYCGSSAGNDPAFGAAADALCRDLARAGVGLVFGGGGGGLMGRVARAELDEEPPATADSPLVQDAWLQRIHELLASGDTEAARNSLAEFRRRYPAYALPEDLRHLAKP